ncbi:MAG: hydrogenase maturation protease [Anaerolineae bacterium]|nr:hydrogenase maturation protease [Anaerolineae bacterium]MDW8070266.1 hydrogenase maturation protease [Anaerolineae bacterium]
MEKAEHPASNKTLVIGFGNPDRQDDGVAWHILERLAEQLGRTVSESLDDDLCRMEPSPVLVRMPQLIPEIAEPISCFGRVCFVDAHTGSYAEEIHFVPLQPEPQISPFTHHLTPQSCLQLTLSLYGRTPQAVLCSVRGYEFGFGRSLSEKTAALAEQALRRIRAWLEEDAQ